MTAPKSSKRSLPELHASQRTQQPTRAAFDSIPVLPMQSTICQHGYEIVFGRLQTTLYMH
ncbi:unnamed protein product [Fusarium graminearum]|nr:unnamed protein product [Fusarium graminearum]